MKILKLKVIDNRWYYSILSKMTATEEKLDVKETELKCAHESLNAIQSSVRRLNTLRKISIDYLDGSGKDGR